MKIKPIFLMLPLVATLTACQSTKVKDIQNPTSQLSQPTQAEKPIAFAITGKIGITTITPQGRQAGSAFYGWSQEGERFAIDLSGALGMGATTIRFDGQTATLKNDQHDLSATSPEELLAKATGWHAPISQLPYWILGKSAPNDTDSVFDGERLTHSKNGDWTATFEHKNHRPNRLTITHTDGHRVVMTIIHEER